jgi:ferritin
MLSEKLHHALNKQIHHEITAAYSYLAMAAWFERRSLNGFASWMLKQRGEELTHAMKLYKFLLDRGGTVELEAVEKPKGDFKTPMDVFVRSLALEKGNTASIDALYALAVQEKDYATQSHLKWFIDEQVEEEKTMNEIEALLKMAGDSHSSLLLLDQKLGQRATAE